MPPSSTVPLPFARTCDHPNCGEQFTPMGDGSTPYISGPLGGLYFCSNTCKESFPQETSLIEHLTAAFVEAGMPSPNESAHIFREKFSMQVEDDIPALLNEDGVTHYFRIITPPAASLIACILSGDQNFDVHTGDDGVTQTLMRIGDFAAVISRVHPNALLREVRNVKLTKQVPLGASVLVAVRQLSVRGQRVEWRVSATLEGTGESICKPTVVVTYGTITD